MNPKKTNTELERVKKFLSRYPHVEKKLNDKNFLMFVLGDAIYRWAS